MAAAKSDLEFCKRITRRGGSNLWLVSKALPAAKKDLFAACYASMRHIDDFVDEEFQSLSKSQRQEQRESALRHVESWLEQSHQALEENANLDPSHEIAPVFRALSSIAGRSNLSPAPWTDLALAMKSDILEEPMEDWEDFDRYAEGATVCPTEIYLYILLCDQQPHCGFTYVSAEELRDQARDMALFCYLVHIARDLKKDMAKGGRLLTIPAKLGQHPIEFIKNNILERASQHRSKMQPIVQRLKDRMHRRERLIFTNLLGIYENLYEQMMRRDSPSGDLEESARQVATRSLQKLEDLSGS